jgi:YHS domain-containing protein
MFRAILEMIAVILIITVLRSVVGILSKGFGEMFRASSPGHSGGTRAPSVPSGGELKKDPVCGTFISTNTAIQKRVGGEIYYFCSAACRDKFKS